MSEWISVKDRLPEPLQAVVALAITESGKEIGIAKWVGMRWFSSQMFCSQSDIKYWMPLPEPPQE